MATLEWALCCQRAIVDQQSEQISLIDLFEGIQLRTQPPTRDDGAIPLVPVRFSLVTYWRRSDPEAGEHGLMRARLLDPSGKAQIEIESQIPLDTAEANRNVVNFPGLPAPLLGTYTIEIAQQISGEWVIEEQAPRLKVSLIETPQQPTEGASTPTPQSHPRRRRRRKPA